MKFHITSQLVRILKNFWPTLESPPFTRSGERDYPIAWLGLTHKHLFETISFLWYAQLRSWHDWYATTFLLGRQMPQYVSSYDSTLRPYLIEQLTPVLHTMSIVFNPVSCNVYSYIFVPYLPLLYALIFLTSRAFAHFLDNIPRFVKCRISVHPLDCMGTIQIYTVFFFVSPKKQVPLYCSASAVWLLLFQFQRRFKIMLSLNGSGRFFPHFYQCSNSNFILQQTLNFLFATTIQLEAKAPRRKVFRCLNSSSVNATHRASTILFEDLQTTVYADPPIRSADQKPPSPTLNGSSLKVVFGAALIVSDQSFDLSMANSRKVPSPTLNGSSLNEPSSDDFDMYDVRTVLDGGSRCWHSSPTLNGSSLNKSNTDTIFESEFVGPMTLANTRRYPSPAPTASFNGDYEENQGRLLVLIVFLNGIFSSDPQILGYRNIAWSHRVLVSDLPSTIFADFFIDHIPHETNAYCYVRFWLYLFQLSHPTLFPDHILPLSWISSPDIQCETFVGRTAQLISKNPKLPSVRIDIQRNTDTLRVDCLGQRNVYLWIQLTVDGIISDAGTEPLHVNQGSLSFPLFPIHSLKTPVRPTSNTILHPASTREAVSTASLSSNSVFTLAPLASILQEYPVGVSYLFSQGSYSSFIQRICGPWDSFHLSSSPTPLRTHMMSDSIMDSYVSSLTALSSTHAGVVPYATVWTILNRPTTPIPGSSSWAGYATLLIPILIPGQHWYLLAYYQANRTLVEYNSYPRCTYGSGIQIRSICIFLGIALSIDHTTIVFKKGTSPAQLDNCSCGYYTAYNMLLLLHKQPLQYTLPQLIQFKRGLLYLCDTTKPFPPMSDLSKIDLDQDHQLLPAFQLQAIKLCQLDQSPGGSEYVESYAARRLDDHFEVLLTAIHSLDMLLIPVPATGSCLFQTISYALFGTLDKALQLRLESISFIWFSFDTITLDCPFTLRTQYMAQYLLPDNYPDVTGHLRHTLQDMERPSCYGTNVELAALSRIYSFNYSLWQVTATNTLAERILQHPYHGRPHISLLYYGAHFDVLMQQKDYRWERYTISASAPIVPLKHVFPLPSLVTRSLLPPPNGIIDLSSDSEGQPNAELPPVPNQGQPPTIRTFSNDILSTPSDTPDHVQLTQPVSRVAVVSTQVTMHHNVEHDPNGALSVPVSSLIPICGNKTTTGIMKYFAPVSSHLRATQAEAHPSQELLPHSNLCQEMIQQPLSSLYPSSPKRYRHRLQHELQRLRTGGHHCKQATLDNYLSSSSPLPREVCASPRDKLQLRVVTHNVNGKFNDVIMRQESIRIFFQLGADIMILVDTRVPPNNTYPLVHSKLLMPGCNITIFPSTPGHQTVSGTHSNVGGITILISPRLASRRCHQFTDPSGLGLAGAVCLRLGPSRSVLVIGTYWPTKPTELLQPNNTLWSRTQAYLTAQQNSITPLQYVQDLCSQWIALASQRSWEIILGGDFNSGIGHNEGMHGDMKPWLLSHCLYSDSLRTRIITKPADHSLLSGTHIDHIMSRGRFKLDTVCSFADDRVSFVYDHLPVVQDFHIDSWNPQTPRAARLTQPFDISIKNKQQVLVYQTIYDKTLQKLSPRVPNTAVSTIPSYCEIEQASVRIESLQQHMVRTASLLIPARKANGLALWSPHMMVHKYHYSFLRSLLLAVNSKTKPPILASVDRLLLQLRSLNNPNKSDTILITEQDLIIDGEPITDWLTLPMFRWSEVLKRHISHLKRQLSYKSRVHKQSLIRNFRERIETRRLVREYKQVLRSVLNRHQQPIEEILLPDSTTQADPAQIHTLLTDQFREHHMQNGRSSEAHNWTQYLASPDTFPSDQAFSKVPLYLTQSFMKAFTKHSLHPTLHTRMRESLERPITFADFQEAINKRPGGKSPGPSGATINMIKALSLTSCRQLYEELSFIWVHRNHPSGRVNPQSWSHRWLCMVPKDKIGPSSINRIRPISLYEVTRKLWTGILNDRITKVWAETHILHPSQYGYRPHLGTESEIIQLLNVIGDAAETNKAFFLMAFDTKKAFDSVNKPLMLAAWIRLGVPEDIAQYLMELDSDGRTTIKTQHANAVYHQLGVRNVLSDHTDDDHAASFIARDGIGQGDSTSATAWLALYDILLCMMESNPFAPYFSRRDQLNVDTCYTFAYADDLNTISPSLEHLQYTVDLVSAYNSITGFQFNEKLECGTNQLHYSGKVITVHDQDWNSFNIPIVHRLPIKILGIPVDLSNGWNDLTAHVRATILKLTTPLQHKNVSYATKLMAYHMAILPAVTYPAKFLDLSLEEFRSLFAPLDSFLRQSAGIQRTSHRQLLYNTPGEAGLGITDVILQIQKFKSSMMARALHPHSPVRNSAVAIIERCHRQAVTSSDHQTLPFDINIKSWLSSVIESHAEVGNRISKERTKRDSNLPISMHSMPGHEDYVIHVTADIDIDSIRDLTYQPHQSAPRRMLPHPLLRHLDLPTSLLSQPHHPVIGRIYLFRDNKLREFLGLSRSMMLFREWYQQSNLTKVKRLSQDKRNSYTPPLPELGHSIAPIEAAHSVLLEPNCLANIVARVHCEHLKNQRGMISRSLVSMIIPDCPPTLRSTDVLELKSHIPGTQSGPPLDIYIDGGLRARQDLFDLLFTISNKNVPKNLTGGAIVLDASSGRAQHTYCVEFPPRLITSPDSFDIEALMVLTMLATINTEHLIGATFYIDNQALVKQISKHLRTDHFPDDPVISTIKQQFYELNISAYWMRSHPERRAKPVAWTQSEKANYSADKLTTGDVEAVHELFPELNGPMTNTFITMPTDKIISLITKRHQFLVLNQFGFPIPLRKQTKQWREHNYTEYLTNRANQSQRNIPWTELTINYSQAILRKDLNLSNTTVMKLIYDRYSNKQYNSTGSDCPLCYAGPDNREHLLICQNSLIQSINGLQMHALEQLPISVELYESNITNLQLQLTSQQIKQIITTDPMTRLGLFNQNQKEMLYEIVNKLQLEPSLVKQLGAYIRKCVGITALALYELISTRNSEVYRNCEFPPRCQPKQLRKHRISQFHLFPEYDSTENFEAPQTLQVQYGFPRNQLCIDITSQSPPDIPIVVLSHLNNCQYLYSQSETNGNRLLCSYNLSDTLCVATSNAYTFPLREEVRGAKHYLHIQCQSNLSHTAQDQLFQRIVKDFHIIPIMPAVHRAIMKQIKTQIAGTTIETYADWTTAYTEVFSHIVSFSDYIEYLNWHYQTETDHIFVRALNLISTHMLLTDDKTQWRRWIDSNMDSRLINVTDQTLSIKIPLTKLSKPNTARTIAMFQANQAIDPTTLIQASDLVIETDFKVYTRYVQLLNELISIFNSGRSLEAINFNIPTITKRVMDLRSELRVSKQLSPHHQTSLRKHVDKLLFRIHRLNKSYTIYDDTVDPPMKNLLIQEPFTITTKLSLAQQVTSQDYSLKGD